MLSQYREGDVLHGDKKNTNKAAGLISYVSVPRQQMTVTFLLELTSTFKAPSPATSRVGATYLLSK